MKKIKVLFIGYGTNLGGIETYLFNLVKNADSSKFEFSFLTFKESKEVVFYNELINMGCKIYKITPRTKNYFKFLKDLKDVYKNNNFDYIHFNLMDFSCFERITYANKYSKANLIIHSHCGSKNYIKTKSIISQLLNKYGKYKIKKINYYRVACGKEAGNFMFNNSSFITFNNGIEFNKFKFNKNYRYEIRKKLNIKNDELCIGLVAAFLPVKNHDFLIDVIDNLRHKKVILLLIGTGPLEDEIKQKVSKLKLDKQVMFLGKRTDTFKFYSAMDIYLMPSVSEGLSISLCEAQINGLKCYTTTGVDRESNISNNVTFLSLDKKAEGWANHIINSNNDRDVNVLKKIPDKFNSKRSYEKVYKFYEDNLR